MRASRIEELSTPLQRILKTVEGIYQNGQIELAELPQNVSDRAQFLVTFFEVDLTNLRQLINQLETITGIQQGFEELNAGSNSPYRGFCPRNAAEI